MEYTMYTLADENRERVHWIHLCKLIGLSRVLTQIISTKNTPLRTHSFARTHTRREKGTLVGQNGMHSLKSVKIDGNNNNKSDAALKYNSEQKEMYV